MSRIGKRAVAIPSGVTANVEGQTVKMKGPKGELKLVQRCEYPLTAMRTVSLVITELGVFEPTGHAFRVIELAQGVTRERVEAATGAPLI